MELLVNDLSLNGQFSDVNEFQAAIQRVMEMRDIARKYRRNFYCHRNFVNNQVTQEWGFKQAIQYFDVNQRRAVMQWLTQIGPFWEDTRAHSSDDYLDYNGEIVTDTALGEAAFCFCQGIPRHLVSLIPSDWMFTPINVTLKNGLNDEQTVNIPNYWDPKDLQDALQALPTPIASWEQLAPVVIARCPTLNLTVNSFTPLRGYPFVESAAQRILILLDTLDQLKQCFDDNKQRTPLGHDIYQNHFTGDKAWFSDSSDTEKREFQQELTFPHPAKPGEYLFCTWHGKVKTPQLRIHFSWPVSADVPLYVVYIGPKITKR